MDNRGHHLIDCPVAKKRGEGLHIGEERYSCSHLYLKSPGTGTPLNSQHMSLDHLFLLVKAGVAGTHPHLDSSSALVNTASLPLLISL